MPTLPPLVDRGPEGGGQRFALRAAAADRRGFGGRIGLDKRPGAPPARVQLRRLLHRHVMRLVDLFTRWDVDGSGDLDPDEFYEAVWALGYDVPRADADALFDSLDADGSGLISYHELRAALMHPPRDVMGEGERPAVACRERSRV